MAPSCEQLFLALHASLEPRLVRLGGAELCLHGANFLRTAARAHQRDRRLRGRGFGLPALAGGALERVVERRQLLTGAHRSPSLHLQLREPSANLEAEIALVELDDALVRVRMFLFRLTPRRQGEPPRRRARPTGSYLSYV